jgi:Spy/CpxP family protein refolding chaperone
MVHGSWLMGHSPFLTILFVRWLNYVFNKPSIIHYQLYKKHSMKKIITGLFAIAAFTFSAVAQDNTTNQKKWDKDGDGYHRGHDGRGMGMDKLNLTEAQKQQMKSINEDFRTRMHALNQNDNILVKDQRAQRASLMQERKNKIDAILTPEQRTQFEAMHKNMGRMRDGKMGDMKMGGDRMQGGRMDAGRMEHMKTELGLTDDQVAKMKEGSESFRTRAKAIRENQSLSDNQRKEQFEALQKERMNSFKSYLTAEQIAKLDQMKMNHGDGKEKMKGDGWKEKKKSEDGKVKTKVKTS